MKKRGKSEKAQANIIVVVLLVVLVLAAVVIVWNVVRATVEKTSEDVSITPFKINLEIKNAEFKLITGAEITVHRGSGKGNITALKFICYNENQQTRVVTKTKDEIIILDELETKTYVINDPMIYDCEKISIIPVFEDDELGMESEKELNTKINETTGEPAPDFPNPDIPGNKEKLQDWGLVSWWEFDGDFDDSVGGNHGPQGVEKIINPDFSSNLSSWTVAGLNDARSWESVIGNPAGSLKLTRVDASGLEGAQQSFALEIGKTYFYSLDVYLPTGSSESLMVGSDYAATINVDPTAYNTWETKTGTFVATNERFYVTIYGGAIGDIGDIAYFDNVFVRESWVPSLKEGVSVFDGVNDWVKVLHNENIQLSYGTWSLWILADMNQCGGEKVDCVPRILKKKDGEGGFDLTMSFTGTPPSGQTIFAHENPLPPPGNGWDETLYSNPLYNTFIVNQQWVHVVYTLEEDKTVSVYINGEFLRSKSWDSVDLIYPTDANLYIGGVGYTHQNNFNGSIDNIMIFNRSLTQPEIQAIYNNQLK